MGDIVSHVEFTPDGKRALVTKFNAHKVSLLDINGIRTPDPRFVSGARTDCAGNGPGDRAVEWDPCNRSSGLVARRSGSIELELAPWATRLTQPLLATAPVRAKNQHTAAFLPGQFRSP